MKKTLCILLACLLMLGMLSGCSKEETPTTEIQPSEGSFEPETTAVAGGGLTQAVEEIQKTQDDVPVPADQPIAADVQQAAADATLEPVFTEEPSSAPATNSHTSIDGYSTIGDVGLDFTFSYPVNWNNLPGRSTVCYVQPMKEGVKYPARVSVTMKKLAHRGTDSKVKDQFASFFKFISSQYDEDTFEAKMSLNTKTKFMGKKGMSTTYLAYDGEQEIKGYAICTYFERYMFVFHFLCAYEDYDSFQPAMQFMRDSVKTTLKFDD